MNLEIAKAKHQYFHFCIFGDNPGNCLASKLIIYISSDEQSCWETHPGDLSPSDSEDSCCEGMLY